MLNEIQTLIRRWSSNNSTNRSEAIVCLRLIIPILRHLGWNVAHDEVHPEYRVEGGEVDYALLTDQVPKAFIEAKKEDEPLERHQEQLLNYAFRQGVVMAILTNGTAWWFYLPLKEGSWENRKFAAVNIDKPELPQQLISLLSKENVICGRNIQSAETLLRSRRIWESLPRAWVALRPEIVSRLIDETEGLCGYRPNTDEVEHFLSRIDNQTPLKLDASEPQADTPSDEPELEDVQGTKPQCFTFDGHSYEVKAWISVWKELCAILCTKHRSDFEVKALNLESAQGYPYFSRNKNDLRKPHKINEDSIFVETNMGARYILKTARMLISHFGYDPNELQVEYSPRG